MSETLPPYAPLSSNDFESQYNRVLEAAECRTQVELAEVLNIRQSSISDAKRRESIPAEWLLKLFEKSQINPDWIRRGIEPKHLIPASGKPYPHVVKIIEARPPEDCSAQDLFNELVRRALQSDDLKAIQKEVAKSWLPTENTTIKSNS